MHYARLRRAPVDGLRSSATRTGIALIEDAAHAPERDARRAGKLGTLGPRRARSASSPTRSSSVGEGGLLAHRRRRGRRVRPLAPLARDDQRHAGTATAGAPTPTTSSASASTTASTSRARRCCCSRLRRLPERHRPPARADAALPRGCWPTSTASPCRSPTTTVATSSVLRDADHARGATAPGRVCAGPARAARRADEHLLPGDPRLHRLPRALPGRLAPAHRAGRAHRGDAAASTRT